MGFWGSFFDKNYSYKKTPVDQFCCTIVQRVNLLLQMRRGCVYMSVMLPSVQWKNNNDNNDQSNSNSFVFRFLYLILFIYLFIPEKNANQGTDSLLLCYKVKWQLNLKDFSLSYVKIKKPIKYSDSSDRSHHLMTRVTVSGISIQSF